MSNELCLKFLSDIVGVELSCEMGFSLHQCFV